MASGGHRHRRAGSWDSPPQALPHAVQAQAARTDATLSRTNRTRPPRGRTAPQWGHKPGVEVGAGGLRVVVEQRVNRDVDGHATRVDTVEPLHPADTRRVSHGVAGSKLAYPQGSRHTCATTYACAPGLPGRGLERAGRDPWCVLIKNVMYSTSLAIRPQAPVKYTVSGDDGDSVDAAERTESSRPFGKVRAQVLQRCPDARLHT